MKYRYVVKHSSTGHYVGSDGTYTPKIDNAWVCCLKDAKALKGSEDKVIEVKVTEYKEVK